LNQELIATRYFNGGVRDHPTQIGLVVEIAGPPSLPPRVYGSCDQSYTERRSRQYWKDPCRRRGSVERCDRTVPTLLGRLHSDFGWIVPRLKRWDTVFGFCCALQFGLPEFRRNGSGSRPADVILFFRPGSAFEVSHVPRFPRLHFARPRAQS
jgi:hypothetical protein